MEDLGVVHFVGLALYTFEDLLTQGPAAVELMKELQRLFPQAALNQVLDATLHSETGQAPEAHRCAWEELQQAIEGGKIARFRAKSEPCDQASQTGVWMSLNATRTRPGHPNYLWLRLPMESFVQAEETVEALLEFGCQAFTSLRAAYGYAGIRISGTSSEAVNRAINRSIGGIPLGDFFDVNIETEFRSRIKGAFWANFLSRTHVEALGGMDHVARTAPCWRVQPLAGEGLLLVLSENPVYRDEKTEQARYAALREFLAPIITTRTPAIPPALARAGREIRRSFTT